MTDLAEPLSRPPGAQSEGCACGSGLKADRCCRLDLRGVAREFGAGEGAALLETMRQAVAVQDHAAAPCCGDRCAE